MKGSSVALKVKNMEANNWKGILESTVTVARGLEALQTEHELLLPEHSVENADGSDGGACLQQSVYNKTKLNYNLCMHEDIEFTT